MSKTKKILLAMITILAGVLTVFLSNGLDKNGLEELKVKVIEVIDGDTIRVKNIKNNEVFRVRYLGIDAPEPNGESYETCFAEEATEKNKDLVLNKELFLEYDVDKYDRFGRHLAYVYVLREGEKDIFVNLELLKTGYAMFFLDKQNILYQEEFVELALAAQSNFEGLWGVCGEEEFNGKCVIKGNVGRMGEKHYHLPGDKYYDDTVIRLDKEDKWLCTIEEAENNNFERALAK